MAALEAIVFSLAPAADERMMQLLLTSLYLVAALLAAAVIIALVHRWRRQRNLQQDLSPSAELARYRALYEAGTISPEEFERLRTVLNARMKQELGLTLPTNETPPPPPQTDIQRPDGSDTGIRPA